MLAFAATTSLTLAAAFVAAGGVIGAALIAGWVSLRAQSAEDQLAAIREIAREYADQIIDTIERHLDERLDARSRGLIYGEIVKRALRETLGTDTRARRWYDDNT